MAAEDADGNLRPALDVALPSGSNVLEVGAGTGRVTRILRSLGHDVVATEPSGNMLAEAVRIGGGDTGCRYCCAEAGYLPARSGAFDAAVAGWVFGHQVEWNPSNWRATIAGFVDECDRVTDGGRIVVIETLGTGHEAPQPPAPLPEYYSWLEGSLGFSRRWIRTDYVFPTVDAAVRTAGAFFGAEFGDVVRERQWSRIPECTGIWTRGPHNW